MRKVFLSIGFLTVCSLLGSPAWAWFAGYSYPTLVTSVYGQATPSLCATCTQGQAWTFRYGSKYVQVWADANGRVYWSSSTTPAAGFLLNTKLGTLIGVSLAKGSTGIVTIVVSYKDSAGVSRTYTKSAPVSGWAINGGSPMIYSYGPEGVIPSAVVDIWMTTMPSGSQPVVSGGAVCGQPSGFRVKKTCP
jgi:hypothetical protein